MIYFVPAPAPIDPMVEDELLTIDEIDAICAEHGDCPVVLDWARAVRSNPTSRR